MTSRKRSRDQVEKDEAHPDPRQLTKAQLVHGLDSFWHTQPTTKTHNALVDQLNDINYVYVTPHVRRPKDKHFQTIRKSTVLTSLQDVAELEHEGYDGDSLRLPQFDYHPIIVDTPNHFTSAMQHRYRIFQQLGSSTGLKSLTKQVRKYYLYQAMQEHEMEHGTMEEDFGLSMVGNSCWTPAEKRKFFMAVERCSRGDVMEISRRVGPTKTVAEVGAYLNLLDGAAKAIGGYEPDDKYAAREMSDLFLLQESRMALILESKLETESYAKDQALMQQESIQASLELFEIWNFSSLTRIFAEINDMTVLSSALVQYHQLVKRFVLDILTSVYTELLDSRDKTVTRSLMNHVIAKRKETWTDMSNKKDVRLSHLDIPAMIDRRYRYHKLFSEHRSASFLAKRRRMAWQRTNDTEQQQEKESIIEIDSDGSDQESSDGVYDSDDDDMLKPFDEEDQLNGLYISQDDTKQHSFESFHQELHDNIDVVNVDDGSWDDDDWEDVDPEPEDEATEQDESLAQPDNAIHDNEKQDSDDAIHKEEKEDSDDELSEEGSEEGSEGDSEDEYDDLAEKRMQQLDYIHEQELTEHLDFANVDAILSRQRRRRW